MGGETLMTLPPLTRDLPSLPATTHRPVRAVGLLRSNSMNSSQLELAAGHMRAYARDHGLELVEICRDDGAGSPFAAVLARLTAGEADAVLVPTERHLSADDDIRESLTWLVAQAGGVVYTMAPT